MVLNNEIVGDAVADYSIPGLQQHKKPMPHKFLACTTSSSWETDFNDLEGLYGDTSSKKYIKQFLRCSDTLGVAT